MAGGPLEPCSTVTHAYLSFLFKKNCLTALGLSCSMGTFSRGMWDLVPWTGIEPGTPALGALSLNHWTTREVPTSAFWEKVIAPHSSTLTWKIPWTEEPGRLLHGVAKKQTWLSNFTFTFHFHALEKETATHSSGLAWRIPGTGEPGGLPSMGRTESDTTEVT